jgi:hypothetical protein
MAAKRTAKCLPLLTPHNSVVITHSFNPLRSKRARPCYRLTINIFRNNSPMIEGFHRKRGCRDCIAIGRRIYHCVDYQCAKGGRGIYLRSIIRCACRRCPRKSRCYFHSHGASAGLGLVILKALSRNRHAAATAVQDHCENNKHPHSLYSIPHTTFHDSDQPSLTTLRPPS